jgi:hypothetical protein
MKLVKIDMQSGQGHYLINVDNIWYISYSKTMRITDVPCEAHAEVYFSDGRPVMILNEEQYNQLIEKHKE